MQTVIRPYFGWFDLLIAAVVLYGIYALLFLIRTQLSRRRQREGIAAKAYQFTNGLLLLYEPLTVLIVATVFVFINPLLHGTLIAIVLLAGFSRLRDYLSGRIVLFTPMIDKGRRLTIGKSQGVISRIDRIGLFLQTPEGLQFINYTRLLTEGYSLQSDLESGGGGYYQLRVLCPEKESRHSKRRLLHKLITTPYLDRGFLPEMSVSVDNPQLITLRVSVHEDHHLSDLGALLLELGYEVVNDAPSAGEGPLFPIQSS